MDKAFDAWNEEKKRIETEYGRFYTVREIWWCKIGVNVGSEQDGNGDFFLRPVVIIRSFGKRMCLIAPLTTSNHTHRLRIPVGIVAVKNATALISQIRVIDTRRFVEKIGFLEKEMFEKLRKSVKEVL